MDEITPQTAHLIAEEIRMACAAIRQEWVHLAQSLYQFQITQGWKALGYETFRDFLSEPDVELSESYVYQLAEAWRTFVIEKNTDVKALERVDFTKARTVLPAVRRGDVTPTHALADALTLRRMDLVSKYKADPHAAIDPSTEPVWEICSACGSRYPVKTS